LSYTALIVDDADFMRVMLREILEGMDLNVIGEAADGAEGAQMYRQVKPDLVFMDITMPVQDGNIALKSILEHDPQANVIMITALGQKDQGKTSQPHWGQAIKAGARDFIIKPFDQERVENTVNGILSVTH